MHKRRLGLIVNPVAGLGGKVGLKGSDGIQVQQKALALGAVPEAGRRAIQALEQMRPLAGEVDLLTCPAEMGEGCARACGFAPVLVGPAAAGATTAEDTRRAARRMADMGLDLLVFAGGDGTARDIHDAVGTAVPALGIPAGVKIHSAVFARTPAIAGEVASAWLQGKGARLREAEVMDLDEEAFRQGLIAPRLWGYLKVPNEERLVQNIKTASHAGEAAALAGIAAAVAERLEEGRLYIVGPGTTTRAIMEHLGFNKTLVGVDVVTRGEAVAQDAGEARILELIAGRPAAIIVTPIGGQGCLFGRGNQPISSRVITRVGRENIHVVSTPEKIHSLEGRPLWVDTGDPETDGMLRGYVRVLTGYREEIVIRISS